MISINLLPWRDSRVTRFRRILFCQLLLAVLLPTLAVAAYTMFETERIAQRLQSMEAYRSANRAVLAKIEMIDSGLQESGRPRLRHRRLVTMINEKNRLPGILEMLTRQPRTGRITKITLDHHRLKITYVTGRVDDSLLLFQLVNSDSALCDVSLDPVVVPSNQKQSVDPGVSSYELNAKLCDHALY